MNSQRPMSFSFMKFYKAHTSPQSCQTQPLSSVSEPIAIAQQTLESYIPAQYHLKIREVLVDLQHKLLKHQLPSKGVQNQLFQQKSELQQKFAALQEKYQNLAVSSNKAIRDLQESNQKIMSQISVKKPPIRRKKPIENKQNRLRTRPQSVRKTHPHLNRSLDSSPGYPNIEQNLQKKMKDLMENNRNLDREVVQLRNDYMELSQKYQTQMELSSKLKQEVQLSRSVENSRTKQAQNRLQHVQAMYEHVVQRYKELHSDMLEKQAFFTEELSQSMPDIEEIQQMGCFSSKKTRSAIKPIQVNPIPQLGVQSNIEKISTHDAEEVEKLPLISRSLDAEKHTELMNSQQAICVDQGCSFNFHLPILQGELELPERNQDIFSYYQGKSLVQLIKVDEKLIWTRFRENKLRKASCKGNCDVGDLSSSIKSVISDYKLI